MALSKQLENKYQKVRSGRTSFDTLSKTYGQELGLPDLQNARQGIRQQVLNTENLLRKLPTDVQSRSRQLGGPVTSSTLNRITAARQQPLATQMGDLSRSEEVQAAGIRDVQSELGRRLDLEQNRRTEESSDWLRRIQGARESEAESRAAQLQREMQRQSQAVAWAQLRAQQEADAKRNAFLKSLGIGGAGPSAMNPTIDNSRFELLQGATGKTGDALSKLLRSAPDALTSPFVNTGFSVARGLADKSTDIVASLFGVDPSRVVAGQNQFLRDIGLARPRVDIRGKAFNRPGIEQILKKGRLK